MDLKKIKSNAASLLKKNKYMLLVLAIGMVLLLIPGKSSKEAQMQSPVTIQQEQKQEIDVTLAKILSKIDGAGEVQVFLTMSQGEETIYQTDTKTSESQTNVQIDTVLVTDADRAQTGLVRQINPPVYQGAIVLCQGADSSTVRLAIVDAVSKVTGLGADRISVLKMK